MRLSADRNSPHYLPSAQFVKVLFNGEETRHVIEACEEEGWILRHVRDENDHIVPIKHSPSNWEAKTEKLYGTVEIILSAENV